MAPLKTSNIYPSPVEVSCDAMDSSGMKKPADEDGLRCLCEPQWMGEFCEQPVCVHGELKGRSCHCEPHWIGVHCDRFVQSAVVWFEERGKRIARCVLLKRASPSQIEIYRLRLSSRPSLTLRPISWAEGRLTPSDLPGVSLAGVGQAAEWVATRSVAAGVWRKGSRVDRCCSPPCSSPSPASLVSFFFFFFSLHEALALESIGIKVSLSFIELQSLEHHDRSGILFFTPRVLPTPNIRAKL